MLKVLTNSCMLTLSPMYFTWQGEESVIASYFMTYHTILKTSRDYYEALLWARQVSDNITQSINSGGTEPTVEVFPYRWGVESSMEEMDCTGYKKNYQHLHRTKHVTTSYGVFWVNVFTLLEAAIDAKGFRAMHHLIVIPIAVCSMCSTSSTWLCGVMWAHRWECRWPLSSLSALYSQALTSFPPSWSSSPSLWFSPTWEDSCTGGVSLSMLCHLSTLSWWVISVKFSVLAVMTRS